ncbi:MAG: 3-oxoacyl-[acyl-carrier-protein] synthase III C-terminal domain-containing protein [Ketobacteraceae bacterium]|nr:3-oxoacyl-[acyl-carrier-protein] synthase III C-terminal domain-containing protein [Ketobacteraceae bacterium]
MSAIIKATGISAAADLNSSIEHAVIAGKNCVEAAGIDMQEVNYIFNVGVYRDSNMVEPSMAALIQKGIGINLDFTRFPVSSPAFSTDLMNGAAGAINAFHMADALFKAGRDGYVLVLSSDVHPSSAPAEGFGITPRGAAVLLAPGNGDTGFKQFVFKDTMDDYVGEASYVDFEQHKTTGRTNITVKKEADFYERLMEFTTQTARNFIAENKLDLSNTALIAPSFTETFAKELGKKLEFPGGSVVNIWAEHGNPHTSAFGLGFDHLKQNPDFGNYSQVLFVGAGAGLNASCALYKR